MRRWRLISLLFTSLIVLLAGCSAPTTAPTAPEPKKAPAPATPAPAAAAPAPASAPTKPAFPTQPIKVVVSHAAGGSTDVPGRLIAPYAEKILGHPLVFDNMVGAGGVLARNFVYKAKPDGYTLLLTQLPSLDMAMFTGSVEYDALKLTKIYAITGRDYLATAVQAGSPIKNLADLMADLPKTTRSVGGAAGASLISVAQYKAIGGEKLRYVPYDTGVTAATDLAGKHIDMVVTNVSMLKPLEEQGLIRIVAVHGPERHPHYPGIPSVAELGRPDLAVAQMTTLLAPPGVPADIVKILGDAFSQAGKDPKFLEDLNKAKLVSQGMGPAEFTAAHVQVHNQIKSIANLLKSVSTTK